MGKYYVKIITDDNKTFEQVVNANDEMGACIVTWERLRIIPKGTTWKVSERGFDRHDDDMIYGGELVAEEISKFRKKRKRPP